MKALLGFLLSMIIYLGGFYLIAKGAFLINSACGLIVSGLILVILAFNVITIANDLLGSD